MAAKKTSRGKARKSVTRAKATRKTASRSARKAPKTNLASGSSVGTPGNPLEWF